MTNFIKKLLDIKDPEPCSHKCTSLEEIKNALGELIQQYTEAECVACGKKILAHRGGFYRNADGKVFCSSGCIDKLIHAKKIYG